MCVHVHVHMCISSHVCAGAHICMYVHVEGRKLMVDVFFDISPPSRLSQNLSFESRFHLFSYLKWLPCLCLPHAMIMRRLSHRPCFYMYTWDPNSQYSRPAYISQQLHSLTKPDMVVYTLNPSTCQADICEIAPV